MNKDFVPYKESIELKELGFDEDCFSYFRYNGTQGPIGLYYSYDQPKDLYVLQPTFSQAFRWFRDKHNLFANIHSTRSWVNSYKIIYWDDSCDSTTIWDGEKNYKIREEAELECLKKLIEIVKQNP
jgi:hypothetical protein